MRAAWHSTCQYLRHCLRQTRSLAPQCATARGRRAQLALDAIPSFAPDLGAAPSRMSKAHMQAAQRLPLHCRRASAPARLQAGITRCAGDKGVLCSYQAEVLLRRALDIRTVYLGSSHAGAHPDVQLTRSQRRCQKPRSHWLDLTVQHVVASAPNVPLCLQTRRSCRRTSRVCCAAAAAMRRAEQRSSQSCARSRQPRAPEIRCAARNACSQSCTPKQSCGTRARGGSCRDTLRSGSALQAQHGVPGPWCALAPQCRATTPA